jgi:hypothetical protein
MWLAVVRDIAIVLLAIESVVIGILLLATLVQIRKLVSLLRDEVKPMLESVNETVRTVRGTTSFVSQSVVDPLIKAKSFSAGTLGALRNLLFVGRKLRRDPKNRQDGLAS